MITIHVEEAATYCIWMLKWTLCDNEHTTNYFSFYTFTDSFDRFYHSFQPLRKDKPVMEQIHKHFTEELQSSIQVCSVVVLDYCTWYKCECLGPEWKQDRKVLWCYPFGPKFLAVPTLWCSIIILSNTLFNRSKCLRVRAHAMNLGSLVLNCCICMPTLKGEIDTLIDEGDLKCKLDMLDKLELEAKDNKEPAW